MFYNLQDQLKFTSSVPNQNGTLNGTPNYFYPYGGKRSASFSALTTKRFTGQYHEAGLPGGEGLSYYGARWYDAQLGRFASADTIVPGPSNPQALNRYSYVQNNPTGRIDPTGHYDVVPGDDPYWKNTGSGGTQNHVYLPIISHQRPSTVTYNNGPACPGSIMCLSTPVPQPTFLPWWAPLAPTATPGPVYRALPSSTATPTAIPWQTPASPSVNWGSPYWSVAAPVAENVATDLGLPLAIRASGRVLGRSVGRIIGSVPLPVTMAVGYGITVGPNLYKNIHNGTGLAETSTDLITDTAGYWASFAGGKLGAVGGTVVAGPGFGTVLGDIGGSASTSVAWDLWVAPQLRPWVRQQLGYYIFGR